MSDESSVSAKVAASFQQLKSAASHLNSVSDELGRPIAELDQILKKLNLGVGAWVTVQRFDDEDGRGGYWEHEVGYAKIGPTWGIAIRTADGNDQWPTDAKTEEWLFGNAPRSLRIAAIDKLPELIERLVKSANDTAEKLQAKIESARQVVAASKLPQFSEVLTRALAEATAKTTAADAARAMLQHTQKQKK